MRSVSAETGEGDPEWSDPDLGPGASAAPVAPGQPARQGTGRGAPPSAGAVSGLRSDERSGRCRVEEAARGSGPDGPGAGGAGGSGSNGPNPRRRRMSSCASSTTTIPTRTSGAGSRAPPSSWSMWTPLPLRERHARSCPAWTSVPCSLAPASGTPPAIWRRSWSGSPRTTTALSASFGSGRLPGKPGFPAAPR